MSEVIDDYDIGLYCGPGLKPADTCRVGLSYLLCLGKGEAFDTRRREKGGPLGVPRTIDRPHDGPNVAGTSASVSIPVHLSTPDKVKPRISPPLKKNKITLSPNEATERVKGHAKNVQCTARRIPFLWEIKLKSMARFDGS